MKNEYPSSKEIIYLLGMGALLVTGIVMPGALYVAKIIADIKEEGNWKKTQKEWKKFNPYLLKRNIKRLQGQKIVEIVKEDDQEVLKLTKKGRTKYLKFKLQKLSLEGGKWDGKWRVVMYDIAKFKKNQQSAFRNIIKQMNMLQLQKSVYITPYPCHEQIEYLREYFGIGEEVFYLVAEKIENESSYRDYFGI